VGHPCDGATEPLPPSTSELCSFADVGVNNANSANACAYRSSCVGSVSSSRTTPPADANPSPVMFSPCWERDADHVNGADPAPTRRYVGGIVARVTRNATQRVSSTDRCGAARSADYHPRRRGPSRLSGCPEGVAWTVPRERIAVYSTPCMSEPAALRAAVGSTYLLDRVDLWEAESCLPGRTRALTECTQCCTSTWLRMCSESGWEPPT
jgi:hypothetical protein